MSTEREGDQAPSPPADPTRGADGYLWDRSGTPDPGVRRLEESLQAARWAGTPRLAGDSAITTGRGPRRPRRAVKLAVAAALAMAAVGAWTAWRTNPMHPPGGGAWPVTVLAGVPRVGDVAAYDSGQVRPGEWLVTDGSSRASLGVGGIGHVTVEPDSRLRLIETGASEHRLELTQGKISAFISAPPRLFLVQTPRALAVDLGCIYTLKIEPDGSGQLKVQAGMVELHRDTAGNGAPGSLAGVARVPADGRCRIDRVTGPGTPYIGDAAAEFIAALVAIDGAVEPGSAEYIEAVGSALGTARARDAVSLWHLVVRVSPQQRGAVLDALAAIVPLPPGTTRQDVMALHESAMEEWWAGVKARY